MTKVVAAAGDWTPGQRIRIKRSPFKDFIGQVIAWDERLNQAQVEVSLFGRPVQFEVATSDLEKL